jgi:hypothetical protein
MTDSIKEKSIIPFCTGFFTLTQSKPKLFFNYFFTRGWGWGHFINIAHLHPFGNFLNIWATTVNVLVIQVTSPHTSASNHGFFKTLLVVWADEEKCSASVLSLLTERTERANQTSDRKLFCLYKCTNLRLQPLIYVRNFKSKFPLTYHHISISKSFPLHKIISCLGLVYRTQSCSRLCYTNSSFKQEFVVPGSFVSCWFLAACNTENIIVFGITHFKEIMSSDMKIQIV